MAEGARMAEQLGADIIDINMGCPAREVTGKHAGSALMRDLDHATRLVEAVVGAVGVPVTFKMRTGWDEASRNAPDLARRAEAVGVTLITVHGRTRCQFFKGEADWAVVRAVKGAVRVPVVINGDIVDPMTAEAALAASGADGVMVGRGAYGAPWMPARIDATLASGRDPGSPPLARQGAVARGHVEAMLTEHGPQHGLRLARKHVGWYLASSGRRRRPSGLAPPAVHLGECRRGAGRTGVVLRRSLPPRSGGDGRMNDAARIPGQHRASAGTSSTTCCSPPCRIPCWCSATTTACSMPTSPRRPSSRSATAC